MTQSDPIAATAIPLDEDEVIRAKVYSLVQRTRDIISQIDGATFPTPASADAKKSVLDALNIFDRPGDDAAARSPAVMLRKILDLQTLVEDLESSHVDRLSWPIVRYCDVMLESMFGAAGPIVFFSTTKEHNYILTPFSAILKDCVHLLVRDNAEMDTLLPAGKDIYCLHLASIENDNLPLYAIIAHELGHALYNQLSKYDANRPTATEIRRFFNARFVPILDRLRAHYEEIIKTKHPGNGTRAQAYGAISAVVNEFVAEIFCDLFAAFVFGPSYFISFQELTWGNDAKKTWRAQPDATTAGISAHPGMNYRLAMIARKTDLYSFLDHAATEFQSLKSGFLRDFPLKIKSINFEHTDDRIDIQLGQKPGYTHVGEILTEYLNEIKTAMNLYIEDVWAFFETRFASLKAQINLTNTAKLLDRLEHHILPNIIPIDDGEDVVRKVLGEPARFECILLASAIYRMAFLINGDLKTSEQIHDQLHQTERLTSKAFEVTYIQSRYQHLVKEAAHGRP